MRCYNLACNQNSKDGSVLCKGCYDVWMDLHPDCGGETGKYIKARSREDYVYLSRPYFSFYFDIWLEAKDGV